MVCEMCGLETTRRRLPSGIRECDVCRKLDHRDQLRQEADRLTARKNELLAELERGEAHHLAIARNEHPEEVARYWAACAGLLDSGSPPPDEVMREVITAQQDAGALVPRRVALSVFHRYLPSIYGSDIDLPRARQAIEVWRTLSGRQALDANPDSDVVPSDSVNLHDGEHLLGQARVVRLAAEHFMEKQTFKARLQAKFAPKAASDLIGGEASVERERQRIREWLGSPSYRSRGVLTITDRRILYVDDSGDHPLTLEHAALLKAAQISPYRFDIVRESPAEHWIFGVTGTAQLLEAVCAGVRNAAASEPIPKE